jgi:hypothetical protein
MLITVTEDHIRRGRRSSPTSCPLALALREATGRAVNVGVWYVYVQGSKEDIPLPNRAASFRAAFDGGYPGVRPFQFQFEIGEL